MAPAQTVRAAISAAGRRPGLADRRERVEESTAEELPPRNRPPLLAAYLDRHGWMPTVKAGFPAFPDPAGLPTFHIILHEWR